MDGTLHPCFRHEPGGQQKLHIPSCRTKPEIVDVSALSFITPAVSHHVIHLTVIVPCRLPISDLHLAGTAFCRSIPDAARRGAFSVDKKGFFLLETEAALSTCVTPLITITPSGTACEAPRPSKSLAGDPQRQIRHAGPFKASVAHHRRFQHLPRSPGHSRISIIASAVTAAKGDYNGCKASSKPMLSRDQTSKNTLNTLVDESHRNHFRSVQTGDCQNLRAVDDTCDGLMESSHTLVFQSTAAFPPCCRPG